MNILLIDDHVGSFDLVKRGLNSIGVFDEIDFVNIQERPPESVVPSLPVAENLNRYDFALVDLELYGAKQGDKYFPDHLAGGTQVLPYFRKNAPWLPIIAYSRLFNEETNYFVSIAGCFDFDGHIERGLFELDSLNQKIWNTIINHAIENRKKSLLDYGYIISSSQIIASENIKNILNKSFPEWIDVLRDCFYYSETLLIEEASEGFSGAKPIMVTTGNDFNGGNTKGKWFVKLSNNHFKLNNEVVSHRNYLKSGVPFARTVPLLWNGIIRKGKTSAIAYQFAENSVSARDMFIRTEDFDNNSKRITTMLIQVYNKNKISSKFEVFGQIIKTIFFDGVLIKGLAKDIKNKILLSCIDSLYDGGIKYAKVIDKIAEYSCGWIHGDLHLGNIVFGEQDIIVDFAHACVGPIAYDFAKIVSSMYITTEEYNNSNLPYINSNRTNFMERISELSSIYLKTEDDRILYNVFLFLELIQNLSYKDIPDGGKRKIVERMNKSEFEI